MKNADYIAQIEDLSPEDIAYGISSGIVSFDELRRTFLFDATKQKIVKSILRKKDDDVFSSAESIEQLENYLFVFPDGHHLSEARSKIQTLKNENDRIIKEKIQREKMIRKIKEDPNEYGPDEILDKLSENELEYICSDLGIDISDIKNYHSPILKFNDIPQVKSDIPSEYTDVFFWGIPSSGKTCALAAIFSTIKKDYSMEAPDCEKKFGATYRDSLVNMFKNNTGYLPEGGTVKDKTQYMPFLLYKRGEKNKRKISFFELSGEVFKFFYEKANNSQVIKDVDREAIEQSFATIDLLLNSDNQKIHFFFIDYNEATKNAEDYNGLTQSNYLEAAATYFRDRSDIFKRKTDAVYVVITKSDEIKGDNKSEKAKEFLQENFGSFMDVLKNQCKNYSVDFKVKLFSIGDVYFKRICKINRSYSSDIINDLLVRVRPANNNRFKTFFNS